MLSPLATAAGTDLMMLTSPTRCFIHTWL